MPLIDTMRAAATAAQSTLSQIQGAPTTGPNAGPNAGTNALYEGTKLLGVYGAAQVIDQIDAGGGYKRRAQIPFSFTRDQVAAVPPAKKIFTRTDLAAPVTYLVDVVNPHDPLVYTLILVKNGG